MNTNVESSNLVDPNKTIVSLPRISILLKKAWRGLSTILPRIWLTILLLLVLQIPAFLLDQNIVSGEGEVVVLSAFFIASVLAWVISIALVHYTIQTFVSESTQNMKNSIAWVFYRAPSILVLIALIFGITITGALLLIIPALVFGLYNMFAYVVLIREEKQSAMQYILRSTELVYGAFWLLLWRVVGVTFVIWLLLAIGALFLYNFLTVLVPSSLDVISDGLFMAIATVAQVATAIATATIVLQLYDVRYAQTVDTLSSNVSKKVTALYWTAAVVGWVGIVAVVLGLFISLWPVVLTS